MIETLFTGIIKSQKKKIQIKFLRVVLNLCGGNIDTTIFGRCLDRGLAAEGRLLKFSVTVSDRPGGISDLCKLISSIGVSIKDILHERAWVISDVFSVEVNAFSFFSLFFLTIQFRILGKSRMRNKRLPTCYRTARDTRKKL